MGRSLIAAKSPRRTTEPIRGNLMASDLDIATGLSLAASAEGLTDLREVKKRRHADESGTKRSDDKGRGEKGSQRRGRCAAGEGDVRTRRERSARVDCVRACYLHDPA